MSTAVEQEAIESGMKAGAQERRVRVAVLGATGYAGGELIALLARHPGVRLTHLMSSGRGGVQAVGDSHPALRGASPVPITPLAAEALSPASTDFAFLATPHEVSRDLAPVLVARGLRVVDLSGAFRLKDAAAYPRWYGFDHHEKNTLAEAVYGLPELNAELIRKARLVANPGCYPTAAILALAPLLRAGALDLSAGIVCDAKSGASGAGRSLRDDLLFCSVSGNCRAYGAFTHRHWPEMLQALGIAEEAFTFVPHLLPVARGILSTQYARLSVPLDAAEVARIFQEFYAGAPLVRVYEAGKLPEIAAVAHTQYADIGFVVEPSGRRIIVVSAIDNLGKGAAGQAVQNMNLMLGFQEDAGLR